MAHRLAPASVLSPFIYTQIIWATALGYLVFGDVPTLLDHRGRRDRDRARAFIFSTAKRKVTGRVAPIEPGCQNRRRGA